MLTVVGLYLATHSVILTIVGTTASALITFWSLWLPQRSRQSRLDTDSG
jgi:hypothetical protein